MSADRPGTLGTADVEHLLRDHLGRRADATEPSLAPVAAVTGRARRRERRQVLLAGLAVVAVVVGGATVARPWLDGPSRSQPATSTDPGPDGLWSVQDVPTRGDLAGSALWREAARDTVDRLARQEQRTAALEHVVFAGRVGPGVLVLASLTPHSDIPDAISPPYTVFWSPTGRTADLQVQALRGAVGGFFSSSNPGPAPEVAAAAVSAPDGTGYAVVVPLRATARTVSVSTGPLMADDGAALRSWSSLPVTDGAVVTQLRQDVPIRVPLARVDGGRAHLVPTPLANSQEELEAFTAEVAQAWGIGPAPDPSVVGAALTVLLEVVPVDRMAVEPVFHGRELPSTSDVVAARVRLDDGSVFHVAGLFFDDQAGTGRTKAVTTLVPGWPVSAATAATTPVVWLDDTSGDAEGGLHARARLALRGSARMEVRDTGATPCAPKRLLGSGPVDANGLGTAVIDVPGGCGRPVRAGDAVVGYTYPDIVAVALDARGREIGRAPLQATPQGTLVDTSEYFEAVLS
jgi:hypothetical protein